MTDEEQVPPLTAEVMTPVDMTLSKEREEQIRHPNSGDLPGEAKALLAALDAARADVRELAEALEQAIEWARWLERYPTYTPIMKAHWPYIAQVALARIHEHAPEVAPERLPKSAYIISAFWQ